MPGVERLAHRAARRDHAAASEQAAEQIEVRAAEVEPVTPSEDVPICQTKSRIFRPALETRRREFLFTATLSTVRRRGLRRFRQAKPQENHIMMNMLTGLLVATVAAHGEGADLRAHGAFGFPQERATVLCDTPDLRVSMVTSATHLYVQAILWNDDDDATGETADGRTIGDSGSLLFAVDPGGRVTANVDRTYHLSPWPAMPGLHYSVQLGGNASTGLQGDSKGRGAVAYVRISDTERVRVDSFLIPYDEIGRGVGDAVRIAYWGSSPSPELTVNSVGYKPAREGRYWSHQLPRADWHTITLTDGPEIDGGAVPEGRGTITVPARKAMPAVGDVPPAFTTADWINWSEDAPPSPASLQGRVVAIEFWATWCPPCIAGIPHLNEIYDRYRERGLVLLSITDQATEHIRAFMEKTPMRYTVGTGSTAATEFGVRGIPHAFVIGRDGKIAWSGHPSDAAFEAAIRKQLDRTEG